MHHSYKSIIITFLLMMTVLMIHAQDIVESDSVVVKKEKKGSIFAGRPGKSMVMSLVIPGAGQIYNKSYLRVPFVWGAVGGMGWLMVDRIKYYNCLADAYKDSVDGVPIELDAHCDQRIKLKTTEQLRILRDNANKNRQLSIIGFAAVWLAQGIDAYVDAHLKDFNINDDLSFDIKAKANQDAYAPMSVGLYVSF